MEICHVSFVCENIERFIQSLAYCLKTGYKEMRDLIETESIFFNLINSNEKKNGRGSFTSSGHCLFFQYTQNNVTACC